MNDLTEAAADEAGAEDDGLVLNLDDLMRSRLTGAVDAVTAVTRTAIWSEVKGPLGRVPLVPAA